MSNLNRALAGNLASAPIAVTTTCSESFELLSLRAIMRPPPPVAAPAAGAAAPELMLMLRRRANKRRTSVESQDDEDETSTVEQRRRERSYGLRIRSTPPMCVLAEATVLPRLASCASLWCALSRCFMIMLPSTLLRPSKSLETAFPMGTARAPFVVDERLTHGDHPLGDGRGLDHALKMSSDVHVTRADQARRLLGERPAGQVHRVPGRARRRHRVSTHAATRARAGGHLVGPVLAVDCKLLAHAGDGGDRL
eukprot:CAMPEP_0185561100 /NCGR_PEP_ID=MMETSP1381-20130426/58422_1 /TAXON_ID=298111 /ORGANISM="Pavlova sp., Strain CCMP459" /LENGTH=252 /DNA_ID=CAMNT_0028174857 /DNA_START=27 /DNA_END=783 /DNA_ORIENTATION=-